MALSRGAAPRYLFVYGTLRRGLANRHARYLSEHAQWIGEARVRGRLYDLGRYPGLCLCSDGDEWAPGELYRMPVSSDLLTTLDQYEGADFERVTALARRAGERSVRTWVYEYQRPVSEARRIASWPIRSEAPRSG